MLETRLASAREAESVCGQAGQLYGRLPDENKVRESQEICGKAKVGIGALEKEIRDAEAAADGLLEKAKADFQSAAEAQALKDALAAYSASGGNFQKAQQTYLRIPRPEKARLAEPERLSAIGKEKETNAEIDKIRNIALELKRQGINHQSSAQRSIIPSVPTTEMINKAAIPRLPSRR